MAKLDYEAYLKCFAGLYKKHARLSHRALFTCFVRDAISHCLGKDVDQRQELKDGARDEQAIGYRIVCSLLRQGFKEEDIHTYTEKMQDVVNDSEYGSKNYDFGELLERYYGCNYSSDDWYKRLNYLRWLHMIDGCMVVEYEDEEDDAAEDDEDDEDDD